MVKVFGKFSKRWRFLNMKISIGSKILRKMAQLTKEAFKFNGNPHKNFNKQCINFSKS
jgi:hypothetical protein